MPTRRELYNYHSTNLSAVQRALTHLALSIRHSIARQQVSTEESLVRLYTLLLATWAEARLVKLIHEKRAFTVEERAHLLDEPSQLACWKATVRKAFQKHYKTRKLSETTLGVANYARHTRIQEILDSEFDLIISLRNRLAHGQWVYPLNNTRNAVATTYMAALKRENFGRLQQKKNILFHVSEIIHHLVVSKPWFETAFDVHYRAILDATRNLEKRSYSSYREQLRAKLQRGRQRATVGLTKSGNPER